VNIRHAEMSDFADVTDLLEQLGRTPVTHESYGASRDVYAAQLEADDTELLVAEDERGNVVGFCALTFRPRLNQVELEAWVPDLIVSAAARGRGTARALLEEAEELARARGCRVITLESGYDRREAHLLYTAAGMQDAGKMFRKTL
jgi:ribosomal protein S18 acetylase RimI-like enzyme